MTRTHARLLLPLALLAACSQFAPPRWERMVGWTGDDEVVLQAPERATVGVPFIVTVRTFGSSSCTRADGAEVQQEGLVAVIVPYDQIQTGDVPCTADVADHPRDVVLRFDQVGQARVRVRGHGMRADRLVTMEEEDTVAIRAPVPRDAV